MALNNLKSLSELAKTAKGRKGKEVLTVPVEDVVSKEQVRKRFRNIEELAATLLNEGQQSPIIVFPRNTEGKYVIQKGERRWRACRYAGIKNIDLIVNDKAQDALDETAGELIENIQRDDLTPVEIAEALTQFIKQGWKQKDIAERIGKNIAFVSTHLSLLKLPDCVRDLYDNEVCSDTETLNNLRLLFDLNEQRCRAVCTVAVSEGITRKQSRELLNDAKSLKEETGIPLGSVGKNNDEKTPLNAEAEEYNTSSSKDRQWKNVRADRLIFTVKLNFQGNIKRGVIMTNRVSLIPSTVWVKILDSEGKEQHVTVPVADIELLSIEG